MTIQAIETKYKGYRFRSRLEARWAVFFDALGIEWEYEKEGFTNGEGDYYLPDFFLPKTKTWVEVKGEKDALVSDAERMTRLLDYGGVLPYFFNSGKEHTTNGLLLLENIPEPVFGYVYLHPIVQHYKGLDKQYVMFNWYGGIDNVCDTKSIVDTNQIIEHFIPQTVLTELAFYEQNLETDADGWFINTKKIRTTRYSTRQIMYEENVIKAYEAARSARFEHGELGGC
jgi:hypothetical protein